MNANYHVVTIHDQATADERIPPALGESPLVVDATPMRGPVDLRMLGDGHPYHWDCLTGEQWSGSSQRHGPAVVWVICGGGDHPLHPNWVRSLRDQAVAAGVPFYFRGWGEWVPFKDPGELGDASIKAPVCLVKPDGRVIRPYAYTDAPGQQMARVGKANSGRLLDGREWSEMPDFPGMEALIR